MSRRLPPDFSRSDDPVEFALSIVNEPGNRERDTDWYRELAPWIEESLERMTRQLPPELPDNEAIHAWPLCWVMRDGEAVLTRIPERSNETHRALVPNGIMLLWNDPERRSKLWRCELETCRRWNFRERLTGKFCSDQCRRTVSNAKRDKAKHAAQERTRYHRSLASWKR